MLKQEAVYGGKAVKALIISEFIAPIQEIASIRWSKLSKYLHQNYGVEVTVLTNRKNTGDQNSAVPVSKVDPLLKEDLKEIYEVWEPDYGKLYLLYCYFRLFLNKKNNIIRTENKKKKKETDIQEMNHSKPAQRNSIIKKITVKLKSIYESLCKDIIRCRIRAKQADSFLNTKKDQMDFDVVISTFGPAWPHLVAERVKKQHPDILWIADFRDPYAKDIDSPLMFWYHKNFTRKHCSGADIITAVNDELNTYAREGQKVVTLHNGFDPLEAKEALKPDKFRLVYTGTLYEGRQKLSMAMKAVKELMDKGCICADDLVLEYAGRQETYFKEQAYPYGIQEYVVCHGEVERTKALKLQQEAAILLQAAWSTKTERPEWTGKMYEYMMSRKPIVYLVAGQVPHSLPSRLMPKLGGVCYEESRHDETYPLMKKYIQDKYTEWKQTGNVTIKSDQDYVSQFAYPVIADKLMDLIRQNIAT